MSNEKTQWRIIGASNHFSEEREENDYYATDPIAIDKLLQVEMPNCYIWEPACGGGHLALRLINNCYTVFESDIVKRGFRCDAIHDFLSDTLPKNLYYKFRGQAFDILTNPPYKQATEFVIKALEILPVGCKCYMFLKLTFLESEKRYKQIFKDNPPIRIHVFSKRVACAKNGDFSRVKESGGSVTAYAWFVWEKGYKGTTTVDWI